LFHQKISSSTKLDYFLLLQRKNGATIFHQLQKRPSFIESDFMSFERMTQDIPTFYLTPFLLVMSPVQCFFDRKHFFTPADLTQGIVATPQGVGGRGPTNQKASGLQTCTHTHTYTHKHIKKISPL
jgi:hypothetical protein